MTVCTKGPRQRALFITRVSDKRRHYTDSHGNMESLSWLALHPASNQGTGVRTGKRV
jgi:hypothetical protein